MRCASTCPIGKVTAVLGRNGTGKTTLLKTLMGLTDRMDGQIRLDGTEIGAEPTFRRARAGIAYVPQGREIIPDFTIRENILMGAFARADGKRADPGTGAGAVSLPDGQSRSRRRRAVRRPATAARDRAGTGRRPEDHPAR